MHFQDWQHLWVAASIENKIDAARRDAATLTPKPDSKRKNKLFIFIVKQSCEPNFTTLTLHLTALMLSSPIHFITKSKTT